MAKHKSKKKHSLGDDFIPLNNPAERPIKKAKLLDYSDSEGSEGENGGVTLRVNDEYAARFEHNKKRAERHRCKLRLVVTCILY